MNLIDLFWLLLFVGAGVSAGTGIGGWVGGVIGALAQLPQFGPIQIYFASFFGLFRAGIDVSPCASVVALEFACETAM